MIDWLHAEFKKRGYQWNIDGQLRNPTREDIHLFLKEINNNLGDGMQFQAGHVIAQKVNGHLDIYLHVGDYGVEIEGAEVVE